MKAHIGDAKFFIILSIAFYLCTANASSKSEIYAEDNLEERIQRKIDVIKSEIRREIEKEEQYRLIQENNDKFDELEREAEETSIDDEPNESKIEESRNVKRESNVEESKSANVENESFNEEGQKIVIENESANGESDKRTPESGESAISKESESDSEESKPNPEKSESPNERIEPKFVENQSANGESKLAPKESEIKSVDDDGNPAESDSENTIVSEVRGNPLEKINEDDSLQNNFLFPSEESQLKGESHRFRRKKRADRRLRKHGRHRRSRKRVQPIAKGVSMNNDLASAYADTFPKTVPRRKNAHLWRFKRV